MNCAGTIFAWNFTSYVLPGSKLISVARNSTLQNSAPVLETTAVTAGRLSGPSLLTAAWAPAPSTASKRKRSTSILVSWAWTNRAESKERAASHTAIDLIKFLFSPVFVSGSTLRPDGLTADRKPPMAKSLPAGRRCQPAHLRKRKRALERKAGIKTGHRLPIETSGQ